jgi:hypothetical protein
MKEEQSIFFPFIALPGIPPEDSVSIPDDNQTGNVLMCTFPGIARKVRGEHGQKIYVILVKAGAELESILGKDAS